MTYTIAVSRAALKGGFPMHILKRQPQTQRAKLSQTYMVRGDRECTVVS